MGLDIIIKSVACQLFRHIGKNRFKWRPCWIYAN